MKIKTIQSKVMEDGSYFAIEQSYRYSEIYDIYRYLGNKKCPQLITVDLVLHTAHLIYNYSLRTIEIDTFLPVLKILNAQLMDSSLNLTKTITDKEILSAARGLAEYLAVSRKILEPDYYVPDFIKSEVETEIALINEHKGYHLSKIIPYMEDYSQFSPRGHYTNKKEFQRYFKAMMWFSRRLFRVEERSPEGIPGAGKWNDKIMLQEVRQMLLLAFLMEGEKIDGKPLIDYYESIYDTLSFLVGRSDDLNIDDVKAIAKKVWGRIPLPSQLSNKRKIMEFALMARKTANPKIDSSGTERKGFSLFGQRFTPDSYILQKLVSKKGSFRYVGNKNKKPFTCGIVEPYGLVRTFPRGLDIFVVLGSGSAAHILKAQGDTSYEGYDKEVTALKEEVIPINERLNRISIYIDFFNAFRTLLKRPVSKFVPNVFYSTEWEYKQLNAALASWTELRHDNILYVKQSYTAVGSAEIATTYPEGYVEPYLAFYMEIKKLISKLYTLIFSKSQVAQILKDNFLEFDKIMSKLIAFSNKELNGEILSGEDFRYISNIAARLKSTTIFPYSIRKKIMKDTEYEMPAVTDVHTDNNSRMVLQEAVGYPFVMKLYIKKKNKIYTLTGGIYSHYEFKRPLENRLTDEEWRRIIFKSKYKPLLIRWFSNLNNEFSIKK